QRKLAEKRNDDNAGAAVSALEIWNSASDCKSHSYLQTKKIKAHGLKIDRQTLLIPLHDEHGNLSSLQKIWPDLQKPGKFIKGFLKGSKIQGSCFTLGQIQDNVVICEGYATGATIHEITGLPVVVAFSSNNLLNITHRVAENHPRAGIIVAADNDRFKPGNPGLTKAKEAAAAVKARLVVPEFASDDGEPTDFNDLYTREGAEVVKGAFLSNDCNLRYAIEQPKEDDCCTNLNLGHNAQNLGNLGHNLGHPQTRLNAQKLNEILAFFHDKKNVRTLQIAGETWWVLKDACDALELSNPSAVADRLNKDDLGSATTTDDMGRKQQVNIVSEIGLYSLILRSKKPAAKELKHLIHDILSTLATPDTASIKEKEPSPDCETEISDEYIPQGFRLTEDALLYYDESTEDYAQVSGHIEVIAHTEDHGSELTGKLVKFITRSGETRQLRLYNNMIIKDGDAIHQLLAGLGLFVSTRKRAKNKLSEYINASNPKQHAKIIKVSGWHESCFITENGIIGEMQNELLIFQSDAEPTAVGTRGTLQDWIENIGKTCIGNSRLVLAVSAAFASILLKPCRRENFGLHFVGSSSEGKSTALYVAASVFGGRKYLRSWRSTDNGLEGIAATHNDMLLILDELGASDPKKVGDSSYMFNSGQGKTRANILGAARKPHTWRIGVLSSGEKDLETHMAEANKRTYAGQSIRLITVFAKPTPESTGLLEKLNGFPGYAALAQHFDKTTQEYYGTPMIAFVKNVIREMDLVRKYFDDALRDSKEKHLLCSANGQDDRVFKFFYTIGFAGELATRYGITGWPAGEALAAAMNEFGRWIAHKGGFGNQEEKQMLHALRCFFQKHQYSRFLLIDKYNEVAEKTLNEAIGYRKNTDAGTIFYAYPERLKDALKREIVADIDDVLKLTAMLGMLERTDKKHLTKMVRIKNKEVRMLVFNGKVLADEEKNEERTNEN
ncbi:MAG: DUF927 domain-containing protein, partial [Holosporaceae bacterium]|nr:DUF927 domain-containing protein [Holosporaceae bacterium]